MSWCLHWRLSFHRSIQNWPTSIQLSARSEFRCGVNRQIYLVISRYISLFLISFIMLHLNQNREDCTIFYFNTCIYKKITWFYFWSKIVNISQSWNQQNLSSTEHMFTTGPLITLPWVFKRKCSCHWKEGASKQRNIYTNLTVGSLEFTESSGVHRESSSTSKISCKLWKTNK